MITNEWILGTQDAGIAIDLRRRALASERKPVCADDADVYDAQAMHLLVYAEGVPAATGRIYHDGRGFRIDALCVLPEYRRQGLGDLAIRLLLYKAFQWADEVAVSTLPCMEGFYKKFGFTTAGAVFLKGKDSFIEMKLKKENCVFPSKCKEDRMP